MSLKPFLDPIDSLYEDVKKKALMRLEYEGLSKSDAVMAKGARFYNDPGRYCLNGIFLYSNHTCTMVSDLDVFELRGEISNQPNHFKMSKI